MPNVGKSTLFNALTRAGAAVASYPFTTIDPNVGVVEIPDPRLEAVAATTDGFELADVDLRQRGQGQLFGARQSGLPDLRLARLHRDLEVISTTRDWARTVIDRDPDFARHPRMRAEVLRRYEGGLDDFAALETG